MTETITQEKATERTPRKRGMGFPIVALPEAVDVLRTAGQHGKEHSASAFARYLGHSTTNSGSYKRRVAAFRDWKFIAGNTGDRVVLTELGQRIAYPTSPEQEKADLQEAFRNCVPFWTIYEDAAKGVAYSLRTVANQGVQLGIAPVSKDQFAQSLSESAVMAGFARVLEDNIVFDSPGREPQDLSRAVASEERQQTEPPIRLPVGDPGGAPQVVVDTAGSQQYQSLSPERRQEEAADRPALLHQQSWDIGGGSFSLEIRSNRELPAEAFMQIGRLMAEVEKLKLILSDGSDSGDGSE